MAVTFYPNLILLRLQNTKIFNATTTSHSKFYYIMRWQFCLNLHSQNVSQITAISFKTLTFLVLPVPLTHTFRKAGHGCDMNKYIF